MSKWSLVHDRFFAVLSQIYEAIRNGADAFLSAEYTICCIFIVVFGSVVFFLVGVGQDSWVEALFTTGAFVLGAVTSILSGYIGMKVRRGTQSHKCSPYRYFFFLHPFQRQVLVCWTWPWV